MFGFFKRKPAPPASPRRALPLATEMSDARLVALIRDTLANEHIAVAALFLVGLANFQVYYSVFCNTRPGEPPREHPATLDGMVEFLAGAHAQYAGTSDHDEINQRRFFYLYLAALLWIAHVRARATPALWDDIADIWVRLLEGGRELRATLDRTSLWNSDEIDFFAEVKNADDGEKHVESVMMPPEVRYHPKVQAWQERDLPQDVRDELAKMDRQLRGA